MGWYASRNIYLFSTKENGNNVFEERIVCFEANDVNVANVKAANEYAISNGFEVHNEQLTYRQDGESLIDGYELWSELYESEKSLNEFYEDHYRKYLYNPKTN